MLLLFSLLLLLLQAATAATTAVDLPSFVSAGFSHGFLVVVVAFDTTNHTDVRIGFAGVADCNFTEVGSGLFEVNQTWYECFAAPAVAGGSVTNAIDVASVWHTDLGALPTLFTLLLTLRFETTVQVTSSLTVLGTGTANVTVFQPDVARPTAAPVPASASGGGGGGGAAAAAAGGAIGGVFGAAVGVACWRARRRQIVMPVDA